MKAMWRVVVALVVVSVSVILVAGPAAAETTDSDTGLSSFLELTDSHKVSVWNYQLSFDQGNVTSPMKGIWAFALSMLWSLYQAGVSVVIWLLDWVLSFKWLEVVAAPFLALSDGLHAVMNAIGAGPAFLTIAAMAAVLWMARGKWALGVYELGMSCLIAVLATSIFANPVQMIAGPDGALIKARDFGVEVAAGLANGGNGGTGSETQQVLTQQLADTFIRLPHQLVNFGRVIDGTTCERAYDEALTDPKADDATLREKIEGCNAEWVEYANNPGPDQLLSLAVIAPAGYAIAFFVGVLAIAVFLAALSALYQGLRLIVTLIFGILPGVARGSFWATLSDLVVSLAELVFAIVFTSGFLIALQSIFGNTTVSTGGRVGTFLLVDILLIVGTVLFWRYRKSIKRSSKRLAELLGSRPGAANHPSNQAQSMGWGAAGGLASSAAKYAALRRMSKGASVASPGRGPEDPAPSPAPGPIRGRVDVVRSPKADASNDQPVLAGGPARKELTAGGPDVPNRPKGSKPPPRSHGGRAARLALLATKVGAAAATGGSSAAVQAIGQTAKSATVRATLATATKHASRAGSPQPKVIKGQVVGRSDTPRVPVANRTVVPEKRPIAMPGGSAAHRTTAPSSTQRVVAPARNESDADAINRRLRARLEARGARPVTKAPKVPSQPPATLF